MLSVSYRARKRVRNGERKPTLGSSEVNNIPVLLEHVHLLDRLDGLDVELLERGLQLLVVGAGGLVDFLRFPARGSFPSVEYVLVCEDGRAAFELSLVARLEVTYPGSRFSVSFMQHRDSVLLTSNVRKPRVGLK